MGRARPLRRHAPCDGPAGFHGEAGGARAAAKIHLTWLHGVYAPHGKDVGVETD